MRQPPNLSGRKQAARGAREARLAAALRDNLRRRKEQARAQTDRRGMPAGLSGGTLSGKSGPDGTDTAD